MKKTPVHKVVTEKPTLFGLPKQAGGFFIGASMLCVFAALFTPVHPIIKIALFIIPPTIIYVAFYLFFSVYTINSFLKKHFSVKIEAIKNKSLSSFKI